MDIILSVNNLNFKDIISYPKIEIERNKATFICGQSGCGKSTLLKLFNVTASSTKGEITYNGNLIDSLDSIELRKEITLVSQTVFLFDGTIEDNFNQYYMYRSLPALSAKDMKKYLSLCCADFDLETKCETMSGGERQRVFVAICLSFMPKVLMLDEPTSALDESTAKRFFTNIKYYCSDNNITLIVISHDKGLANVFADNIVKLEKRLSI